MLNFNNLRINRLIVHTIIAKRIMSESSATVEFGVSLIEISEPVLNTIKERLIYALGKESKSFGLEIEKIDDDSFFNHSKKLNELNDADFIKSSQDIASLLAESQKLTSIPGGYIIIMDAVDTSTNRNIYIVLKAELHQALNYNGTNQLEYLDKIFLSPSQKLYKIGVLYEKLNEIDDSVEVNDAYGAILYDDQIRPAEYFWKEFLGFTVDKNPKIQSKSFYDKTNKFFRDNFDGVQKDNLLNSLRNLFNINLEQTITPMAYVANILEADLRDKYRREVANNLPNTFVKDKSLLKTNLTRRKIEFGNKIKITGLNSTFDNQVTIINEEDQLTELSINSDEYTLIKIIGKPFS